MSDFSPQDKVIKKAETDPRNYGYVMDIPLIQQKPGYVAVYFQRHVWVKSENLMHFDEWERKRNKKQQTTPQGSLKDYWTGK